MFKGVYTVYTSLYRNETELKKMLNKIIRNIKGTHYVNFNGSTPVAFKVSSAESNEVRFKISYVLCFKFLGVYIPVQRGQA